MKTRTAVAVALAVTLGPPLVGIATPKSAPAWLLYTEDVLLFGDAAMLALVLLAVLVLPARVLDRLMAMVATPEGKSSDSQETRIQALDSRSDEIARIQDVFGSAAKIVDRDGGDAR